MSKQERKSTYYCPIDAVLSIIGGKYKSIIMYHLLKKTQQYHELQHLMPQATPKMLTKQLRELEEDGVRKVNETTRCGFGAPAFLVLGADSAGAWIREEDHHNSADVDAGIIGTHILFAVQNLGLGTTWVGRVDPVKLTELFPVMKGYDIAGIFPIGYPVEGKAGQPGKNHAKRKPVEDISDFI